MESSFPGLIDSTMLVLFRECPQKFFNRFVRRLVPLGDDSIDLIAGQALHAGLREARLAFLGGESDYEERGLAELIRAYGPHEPPESKPGKSLFSVIRAYAGYLEVYPLDRAKILVEDRPMVEVTFALPTEVPNPETGDPILYCGRIDWIGKAFGGLFCYDEKTTGRFSPGWGAQWDLRNQFLGYVYAARTFGLDVRGCIVRGVGLDAGEFRESIVYGAEHRLNLWWRQLNRDLARMVQAWRESWWDYALDCIGKFGRPCEYIPLCSSAHPERLLSGFRTADVWNPLDT